MTSKDLNNWLNQTDFKNQNVFHKVCKRGMYEIMKGNDTHEDVKKIIEMLYWYKVDDSIPDVNNETPKEMIQKLSVK